MWLPWFWINIFWNSGFFCSFTQDFIGGSYRKYVQAFFQYEVFLPKMTSREFLAGILPKLLSVFLLTNSWNPFSCSFLNFYQRPGCFDPGVFSGIYSTGFLEITFGAPPGIYSTFPPGISLEMYLRNFGKISRHYPWKSSRWHLPRNAYISQERNLARSCR